MSRKKIFIIVVMFIISCAYSYAKRTNKLIEPIKKGDEIILFNTSKDEVDVIRNYTAEWKKESNLTPHTRIVTKDGENWVEFSYTGNKGDAWSTIYFKEHIIEHIIKRGVRGIKLRINYDKNDYANIQVKVNFSDNTFLSATLTLEKGTKEYRIEEGYRPKKYRDLPIRWDLIKSISLCVKYNDKNNLRYCLRRISLLLGNKDLLKALKINRFRKVHEILPVKKRIIIDGILSEDEWANVRCLDAYYYFGTDRVVEEKSSFQVKIGYDDKYLYIASKTYFPSYPKSIIQKHDGPVYSDDAIEYFFSAQNDNDKYIQFVVNYKGTVFDSIREFDLTAARVINKSTWDLTHKKSFSYKNKEWIAEISFPLKDLKIDLRKRNYIGFQIAQDYAGREKEDIICWEKSNRLPKPTNFGILVFNRHPFKAGDIKIKNIKRRSQTGTQKVDFLIECCLNKFKPGNYVIRQTIVTPDNFVFEKEEEIRLKGNKIEKIFKVTNVKNRNGLYTYYFVVINSQRDTKLVVADFYNSVKPKEILNKTVFCPKVKKIGWEKGSFCTTSIRYLYIKDKATPRTIKTARIFIKKYYEYTGRMLKIKKEFIEGIKKGIIFSIKPTGTFHNKAVKLKKQGYLLKVEKECVKLTGADEEGLYYAGVTFFQLIKNAIHREERDTLPCVEILDWPDLYYRVCLLNHPWHWPGKGFKDEVTIKDLREWTDRYVIGNKINIFLLNIAWAINYKRHKELNRPHKPYSLDELRRFANYCRDNFIEVCPTFEIASHANWWYQEYHPELREKGFAHQVDVTLPEHDKFIKDCLLDVIEAMKPKYVFPGGDEWWQKRQPGEKPDKLLRGKPRDQVFYEFCIDLNNWLKKRGITMIYYHDMLTPYHNGKRYNIYKSISKFPKDVIIAAWSDCHLEYFLDKGFKVWIESTGWCKSAYKSVKDRVEGFGITMYGFGYTSSIHRYCRLTLLDQLYRSADYAWNIKEDEGETIDDQIESGRMGALYWIFATKPNSIAGKKIEPVNIKNSLNYSLRKFFREELKSETYPELPLGIKRVGFIPMNLYGNKENNCIIIQKGQRSYIPVGKKYSSLIFLHATHIDKDYGKYIKYKHRDWPYGPPCGNYFIHYEDGVVIKANIRLSKNIYKINAKFFERYPVDCIYTYTIEDKKKGNSYCFYQWEWINPRPDKKIVNIELRHDNYFDITVILLSISGRQIKSIIDRSTSRKSEYMK